MHTRDFRPRETLVLVNPSRAGGRTGGQQGSSRQDYQGIVRTVLGSGTGSSHRASCHRPANNPKIMILAIQLNLLWSRSVHDFSKA